MATCQPDPPPDEGQFPVVTALVLDDAGTFAWAEGGVVNFDVVQGVWEGGSSHESHRGALGSTRQFQQYVSVQNGTGAPTTASAPVTTAAPAAGEEDGRFPGNITRAYMAADGTPHVEIDYVLFYSGADAQAQAAARGTDAPNDIFIVNDNPRLRDFAVADGIGQRRTGADDDGDASSALTVTV